MQLNPVVNRICLVQPSLNHLIQSAEFNNLTGFTCARPALVIHFWSSKLFSGPEVACNWKWNYSLKTLNTGKETGVRNIPVISKGYSVIHLDFCGDNMFKFFLFSHSPLTAGNALLMCIVGNFYIKNGGSGLALLMWKTLDNTDLKGRLECCQGQPVYQVLIHAVEISHKPQTLQQNWNQGGDEKEWDWHYNHRKSKQRPTIQSHKK